MKIHWLLLSGLFLLAIPRLVAATTIGYWRLEEGPNATKASTLVSQANSPLLDGDENAVGANSMYYSTQVPGPQIQDGVGGSKVSNTLSLYTERVGVLNGTGNRFDVDDNTNNPPLTEPRTFTFETFIKADTNDVTAFRTIARKTRGGADGSWFLMANNGKLMLRADTNTTGSSGDGWNESVSTTVATHGSIDDGEWHHIAVTYEEPDGAGVFKLYKDYQLVGTLNPKDTGENKIVYDGGILHIGGRSSGNGWQGWIDEPRLSNVVLSTDDFLLAVPEPSSVVLLGMATVVLPVIRRRQRRRRQSA